MKKVMVAGVAAVVLAGAVFPATARAQAAEDEKSDKALNIIYIAGAKFAANDPLRRSTMFSSLYLLGGGGGSHSVALAGDDAIALVDTKGPGWGEALRIKAGLTTDLPIELIINTSPRAAGANAEFPDAKQIVAHEDTKARLVGTEPFAGERAKGLPNLTFTDTLSVPFKVPGETVGKTIDMYHFGAGHSGGDTIVVFPTYGVAVFGDLFPGKQVPVIDVANGGSAVAISDTLAKAVEGLKDKGIDTIIPGRGEWPPKAILRWITMGDLAEYAALNKDLLDSAKASLASGQSADEAATAATSLLSKKYPNYGLTNTRANVEAIYAELGR
jgi:glyoxylase-like metal-dependent hydrolase (beta-lactamase superfamily II)